MGASEGTGRSSEPIGASASTATPQGTSAACIFVSYASQDAGVACDIVDCLERHGLNCWMAPRDVKPGAQYADAIVRAINEAEALVLVLSANAIASTHIGKEVERASAKRKPIIAFRVDAAPLNPALEYFLSESQWIDVAALGMPAALAKLADAVEALAAGQRDACRAPLKLEAARAASRPRWITVAAISLVVVAVIAVGVHFWSPVSQSGRQGATPAIADKSIAVLPFVDMSEKKDQEYFADGIAEEVLDRLAKVPGLKVVGRASSFQFKGAIVDPAEVGAALGVSYLLEGSVRKEADRVRVTAQLVEAKTGAQRWSDRFDSDTVDVLSVQDTIAAGLARALQIAVETDAGHRSPIKSTEALDAYLRGLQYRSLQSRESSEAAVANFKKALALEPTFAPAAIGLAYTYTDIGSEGWLPSKVAFERARDAARVAQQLDPKSAAPHVVMAFIHVYHDWDWAGADAELQQAFALAPRETNGADAASELAAALGQWDEAREQAIEAVELDPLSPSAYMILGWNVYLHTGQFGDAERSFRRGLQIAPHWGSARYFLGQSLMLQGHLEEALSEFAKETSDDGKLEGSAMAHFAQGRKGESDAELAEAIQHNGTSWPSEIARVYAFRGESDRAFEWLERAYEGRDEDLYIIKGDPLFKNLQRDPRYKAFLKKMNLPDS